MATVHMIIGIPGSGKSTLSKQIAENQQALYLSSDGLRKELYGDENILGDKKVIFDELLKRTKSALKNGINVVYDATNTNRKKRMHFIKQEMIGHYVEAHVLLTPFDICVERDLGRSRNVGINALTRIYKNFQFPFKSEGFKRITYYIEKQELPKKELFEEVLLNLKTYNELYSILNLLPDFKTVYEVPQDSTYHSFSISRHIYYVYRAMHEGAKLMVNIPNPLNRSKIEEKFIIPYEDENKLQMLWASVFHDIGKGFCKSFFNHKLEEKRYANFIGHDNVSSYIAFYYLKNLGYDERFVLDVVEIIAFHMESKNLTSKSDQKLKELLSKKQYERLILFNDYDDSAK